LALFDYFLFPKIKLKLKGHRFDTIEEIQAKSQTVLDTVTENGFQQAFQKWRRGDFYDFYSVSPIVLNSGSLNLLEPSGPVKACNGIALPLPYFIHPEYFGYRLFCTLLVLCSY
jgi:hypothetical protein